MKTVFDPLKNNTIIKLQLIFDQVKCIKSTIKI
jgi:hypothetical protein